MGLETDPGMVLGHIASPSFYLKYTGNRFCYESVGLRLLDLFVLPPSISDNIFPEMSHFLIQL